MTQLPKSVAVFCRNIEEICKFMDNEAPTNVYPITLPTNEFGGGYWLVYNRPRVELVEQWKKSRLSIRTY